MALVEEGAIMNFNNYNPVIRPGFYPPGCSFRAIIIYYHVFIVGIVLPEAAPDSLLKLGQTPLAGGNQTDPGEMRATSSGRTDRPTFIFQPGNRPTGGLFNL